MKLQLFGKQNCREQKELILNQLIDVARDPKAHVNEQAMASVIQSLFNHIEDLEEFICLGAGIEYNEGDGSGMDSDRIHFDEGDFEI